ncbi:DUF11 domain-containing protein [Romboutsia sp.]|uniref:DUF11 domain-containing protein n=1 Tax=Romboutsia sp. TaxID=1965302 RepID=UPI003F2AAE83
MSPYNPSKNLQPGIICVSNTSNSNNGLLDTRGTFGSANNNHYNGTGPNPNRTWVDITGMDVSSAISNSINTVTVSGVCTHGGYWLTTNIFAFEITSLIYPIKSVDKVFANTGDTLNYTIVVTNTETIPYTNVVLIDTIQTGTTFIPNSLIVNGVSVPGNPSPPSGVNIGSIPGVTTISGGLIKI